MLIPEGSWAWCWDDDADCLAIQLHNGLYFKTAYQQRQLHNEALSRAPFDIQHMQIYMQISDFLIDIPVCLSSAQKTQIALNATAAISFHKPVPNKSWFYQDCPAGGCSNQYASLLTQDGQGQVLVLETQNQFSTCLLLSDQLKLDSGLVLDPFSVIKVASNRLHSITEALSARKTA